MVGTFYESSSPEDPPFMKIGDVVEKGTVVCIIEAMKVMNEIKAQTSGTVVEICVNNGQPVEFGAKLFVLIQFKSFMQKILIANRGEIAVRILSAPVMILIYKP